VVKFSIIFSSKNKKSLNLFQNYLIKFIKNNNKFFKMRKRSCKIKKLNLLRSPHIHKRSQETFLFNFFFGKLTFFFYNNFIVFLHTVKKICLNSFYDIKVNSTFIIFQKKSIFSLNKNLSVNKLLLFSVFYFKKRMQTKQFIKFTNFKGFLKLFK
jgi:hypothetical protein